MPTRVAPQMFQITFSFSLALGAQILMGHWTGARRFVDVDRLYWKIVRRATLVAFLYAGTAWLFSERVLGFFTADESIPPARPVRCCSSRCSTSRRARKHIITGFALKTGG